MLSYLSQTLVSVAPSSLPPPPSKQLPRVPPPSLLHQDVQMGVACHLEEEQHPRSGRLSDSYFWAQSLWSSWLCPCFTATPRRLLQNMRAEYSLRVGLWFSHYLLCCHGIIRWHLPTNCINYCQPRGSERPGYEAPRKQRRKRPRFSPLSTCLRLLLINVKEFYMPRFACSRLSPWEMRGSVP